MPEEENKSEIKSEIAEHKPRDEHGRFVETEPPQQPESPKDPISKLFGEHTHYSKSQDDILDIKVGNPLKRITELLEQIKKQKAFSFTLKGSLGIAGVALALGVFGVFGGGQILCERGVQSHIGTIKTLNVLETESSTIPVLSQFLDYFNPKQEHNKTVLVKENNEVIKLPFSRNVNISQYNNYPVIATGNYDACSQSLSVNNQSGLEVYIRSSK